MGDNTAFEFKGRISGIIGGTLILISLFVDPLGNMGGPKAGYRFDVSKKVVQHIAPVAEHIDDNAAVLFLYIVPAWPLGGNGIALENPVPEFAANGKYLPKKTLFDESLDFQHPRKPKFILHYPVFQVVFFAEAVHFQNLFSGYARRFFAIDMLSGLDGFF